MGSYKEDKDQCFRTLFFLILVFLFVLVFADGRENNNPVAEKYTSQDERGSGASLSHSNAVIFDIDRTADHYKYDKRSRYPAGIDLSSLRNNISCHDRRVAQSYLVIQRIKLSREPFLPFIIYFYHSPADDDILPSLS